MAVSLVSTGITFPDNTTQTTAAAGGLSAATQAQMEAASSNTVAVTPLSAKWSPGACKLWIKCTPNGTISASYNVSSTSDFGTGAVRITIDNDFSTDNYAISATAVWNGGNPVFCNISNNPEASKFEILSWQSFTVGNEPNFYLAACFGTLV